MFRFLFRLMATFALAVAVIMAVLDVTRTVAASRLVITPLGASWRGVSPASLEQVQSFVLEKAHPLIWNPIMTFILDLPGFLVFGALAFLFYAVGHRPERRIGRFAVER